MSQVDFRTKVATMAELIEFVWHSKTWWLTPIVVIILLVGVLLILAESSALAPFIYALF